MLILGEGMLCQIMVPPLSIFPRADLEFKPVSSKPCWTMIFEVLQSEEARVSSPVGTAGIQYVGVVVGHRPVLFHSNTG